MKEMKPTTPLEALGALIEDLRKILRRG